MIEPGHVVSRRFRAVRVSDASTVVIVALASLSGVSVEEADSIGAGWERRDVLAEASAGASIALASLRVRVRGPLPLGFLVCVHR
jgi:hypothetical protein